MITQSIIFETKFNSFAFVMQKPGRFVGAKQYKTTDETLGANLKASLPKRNRKPWLLLYIQEPFLYL